jgi:hypothetical protein
MEKTTLRPACVRLGNEQFMVQVAENNIPVLKYAMRVKDKRGKLRKLTRDEQLAWAAAPGTEAERDVASKRATIPDEGVNMTLLPRQWKPGEIEQVMAQLERSETNIDKLS